MNQTQAATKKETDTLRDDNQGQMIKSRGRKRDKDRKQSMTHED